MPARAVSSVKTGKVRGDCFGEAESEINHAATAAQTSKRGREADPMNRARDETQGRGTMVHHKYTHRQQRPAVRDSRPLQQQADCRFSLLEIKPQLVFASSSAGPRISGCRDCS